MTDLLPSHLFHNANSGRPIAERALGIYIFDRDGRRFLDGASGAVAVNVGHGNRHVIEAMKRQLDKVAFAYPLQFRNEPAETLGRRLAALMPPGLDRFYLVSGGSEAVETAVKIARQWAVATGQPGRFKVIAREPSYHGVTLGALSVTVDELLVKTFQPMMRPMPSVPAPAAFRDRDGLSMEERGLRYADMLEARILAEGPESVLAFIIEPIGGAATAALVAPDSYYGRVREICDRHGVLLIHDEVMSGVGRTGKFLGGDHWGCRPDIVALSKGLGSGYAPLGAAAASERLVAPLVKAGGFQHGHTYGGNPLAAAAGVAVLDEIESRDLMGNAAAMGGRLMEALRELAARFPFIGDVRGKGLLIGAELVADPETLEPPPPELRISQRLLDHAFRRGLILYSRRVRAGPPSENFMVAPPLIITREEVGELVGILSDALAALADELDLPKGS